MGGGGELFYCGLFIGRLLSRVTAGGKKAIIVGTVGIAAIYISSYRSLPV
jgi:hypothetical protein